MRQDKGETAVIHTAAVKSAGGFSDRFLGIASNPNNIEFMQFCITQFGLQGTFHITPKVREKALSEWRDDAGDLTACDDQHANRTTIVALNTPCTQKDMRKIVKMGRESPDRYDADLIKSLMTIQTWQQNRADEEECHIPLKFVAFDNSVPAAFASLDIHLRDQPQASAAYIWCAVDMLVIDVDKVNRGFDLDLAIACAECVSDTLAQIYRMLPGNRTVITDIRSEIDREEDCQFFHSIADAALISWESSCMDELLAGKAVVIERPFVDIAEGFSAVGTMIEPCGGHDEDFYF
ncbi:hypothetical protein GGI1_03978 [Acidithiobacillus sp. GGI-221]|nr:hypothetical protein GGI1_03978 [Acidithiobacillus sp. GGI-221]